MWKNVLVGLMLVSLAGVTGAGYMGIFLFRPHWLLPNLRREFSTIGLDVGTATRADVEQAFGTPGRVRREESGLLCEYPDLGLTLRMDAQSGKLFWYEVTSDRFMSGRGIRVGAAEAAVLSAYGRPASQIRLSTGSRLRYTFGRAYALEFWLNVSEKVERIVFYRA